MVMRVNRRVSEFRPQPGTVIERSMFPRWHHPSASPALIENALEYEHQRVIFRSAPSVTSCSGIHNSVRPFRTYICRQTEQSDDWTPQYNTKL